MNKFEEQETKTQPEKSKNHEFSRQESFVMEVCAVIITILSIGVFVAFVVTMATIATEITTS
ncbi:MAG: hypothetical protein K2H66_04435 [Oscillospiraceae bacterium]|nr:hypothetical protein [Oscillospiraceae bacterium]